MATTSNARFLMSGKPTNELVLHLCQKQFETINIVIANKDSSAKMPRSNTFQLHSYIKQVVTEHSNITNMKYTRQGKLLFSTSDPVDCFVSDSTFESDHNPVDTTRSLLRETSKTIKTIDWNSIMKNSSEILSSSNSDLHTVMSKVSEMIKQDTKHTALPGWVPTPVFPLVPSAVRVLPHHSEQEESSWLASASVVSRFMAVNNSQVKGGRRGQTVSVHPFTRALPRDLPKNAPSKWSDWSEFHGAQSTSTNLERLEVCQTTRRGNKAYCIKPRSYGMSFVKFGSRFAL
ncbi:hypothetical protein AVEN_148397-1 [Araneus ventricosus]|uniref:Uncharacterized protein n=1 Tax=Araneus ventricosus TaxID=182803 RepID=A0A4Y2QF44_ARAVE|nr:hypothetical protein AVEN_242906-1 [Araneus ventricosus]GBN61980.1 hypothetical protein AVEN_148397-1 [Araneus ventricosus]